MKEKKIKFSRKYADKVGIYSWHMSLIEIKNVCFQLNS